MHRFAFEELSQTPLVSVVLTSYNYAEYVDQAIRSVYAQRYENVELIVVDDGSEDDSRSVIEAAVSGAPLPTETIFKENGGQASAFNAGFGQARGELVCFLDSDDYWVDTRVERMVEFVRTQPDGGVYQHQLDNGSGKYYMDLLISGDVFRRWLELSTFNTALRHDLFIIFVPTSGLLWRKEVLDRIFPMPAAILACPDAYLVFSACQYGPLYSSSEVLGTWREHGENAGMERRFDFHRFWRPVIMPLLNERFREQGVPLRFVYHPWAVIFEPVRLVREALKRRRNKRKTPGPGSKGSD